MTAGSRGERAAVPESPPRDPLASDDLPGSGDRHVVVVTEPDSGDVEAHGPYDKAAAEEVAGAFRRELDSYDMAWVQVEVARLFRPSSASGTPTGLGWSAVDARIRRELDASPGQEHSDAPRALARRTHALRAVLDECRVFDRDPDTTQLAEDIRAIIAVALHLPSS